MHQHDGPRPQRGLDWLRGAAASRLRRHRWRTSGGAAGDGQGEAERGAAPGRFSAQIRPPWASHDRRGRWPARARCRARCPPLAAEELVEDRASPRPARSPGPRSATSTLTDAVLRAGRDLDRAAGRRVLDRVVEQVDQHLLDQHASSGTSGRSAGKSMSTRRGLQAAGRARRAPRPTTSSSGCHSLLDATARRTRGASCRAGCSRAGSGARPPRGSSRAARAGRPVQRAPASTRVLAAPVIAASGVRRSCDTALSSELRSRSVSDPHLRLLGLLGEDRPLDGERGLAGEGLQQLALLGRRQAPRRIRRPDRRARPRCRASATQRQVERRAPGSVAVPRPGQLTVLEHPLGHAPLLGVPARWRRSRRLGLEPAPLRSGSSMATRVRTPPRCAAPATRSSSSSPAWLASPGSSRRAPPSAARAGAPRSAWRGSAR